MSWLRKSPQRHLADGHFPALLLVTQIPVRGETARLFRESGCFALERVVVAAFFRGIDPAFILEEGFQ